MGLLDRIDSPHDLKKLETKELYLLADEVRRLMIKTVSQTGGHLAPSLGAVELTLALHYVFNSGKDQIVWDVGHQAYAHKIITGRKEQFSTLRQYGGISGFLKREESPHDAFNAGHSSTSISAALGFALARDRRGEDHDVIAVIGDGALTGGQAYEAMNQVGHLGLDLLVILNDNEMSIAHNVGAMSTYLSRLRADPLYAKRKKDIELLLRRVPAIGPNVVRAMERVKDSLKYLFVPGMLFEELGFTYLGPIDGHDIAELIKVLCKAKELKGPVLLHALTQKGKGYRPAEQSPSLYHGVGPFDPESGNIRKKEGPPSYTSVFSQTMLDLAFRDNRVTAITAAMPEGTGLDAFARQFPERFYDVGIAEQNAVTMAAAMALKGLRPVVAIYSTFLQRAYDQVLHDVCLQNAPVVFALDRAGLVGEDGATHHGAFDLSYLRHIPGISIMAPRDEEELRHMLFTALQQEKPVAIRYPRGKGTGVEISKEYRTLPWGKGEVMEAGELLLLLAVGTMVHPALEVREILKKEGFSATVVNARFIKPLDRELILDAARRHQYIVTLEENALAGGFGSSVLELLADEGIRDKEIFNIGLPDRFVTHGQVEKLRETLGLLPGTMAEKIIERFQLGVKKPKKVVLSFFNKK